MGYFAEHIAVPANAARARYWTVGDILSLLATRRPAPDATTVLMRLDSDTVVGCDTADATALETAGLATRV